METEIFYERLVGEESISTNFLISVSEARRKVHSSMQQKYLVYESCKEYQEAFKKLCHVIQHHQVPLAKQPLFQWNKNNSSCWYFELLHLNDIYFNACLEKADKTSGIKEKSKIYKEAVEIANESAFVCQKYKWKDVSNTSNKLLHDRYWLAQSFAAAGDYYTTVFDFSVSQEKASEKGARLAYECAEVCSKLWKGVGSFEKEIKAKTRLLFHIATRLEDNQCGEKLALLEPMIKKHSKLIPENVKEQYTRWESENHSVYFQEVKTDIKVIPSSLSSLIPTVLALS